MKYKKLIYALVFVFMVGVVSIGAVRSKSVAEILPPGPKPKQVTEILPPGPKPRPIAEILPPGPKPRPIA